jgi:hypothetical protein
VSLLGQPAPGCSIGRRYRHGHVNSSLSASKSLLTKPSRLMGSGVFAAVASLSHPATG